jgi:hypothetical protein
MLGSLLPKLRPRKCGLPPSTSTSDTPKFFSDQGAAVDGIVSLHVGRHSALWKLPKTTSRNISLGQPLSMCRCEDGLMNIKEVSLKAVRFQPLGDPAILPARHVDARDLQLPVATRIRTSRICICCGEPMVELGNALSRNPNVCASCSSLADGMEAENDQEVT